MGRNKKSLVMAAAIVGIVLVIGTGIFMGSRGGQAEKGTAISANAKVNEEKEIAPPKNVQPEENVEKQEEQEKQNTENSKNIVIALDPGHQGPNVEMSDMEEDAPGSGVMKLKTTSGTSGRYTGLPEYQLNLVIAFKVKDALTKQGYEVVMTREDNDTAMSNQDRARFANESGADFCVRIHANGSESPESEGALCLVMSEENPYVGELYGESTQLAQRILDSYCNVTGFSNRGIQISDTMTGINWSQIPVVILEMGFMTNEQNDTAMADAGFQDTIADGITQGIMKYCSDKQAENNSTEAD